MSHSISTETSRPPFIARTVRALAPLVILAWLALTVVANVAAVGWHWASAIPSLEHVAERHSVSLMPQDAPSVKGLMRIGQDFKESNSDSSAMIVLEGQQPLDEQAHQYYAQLVQQLRADPTHVEHVQDLWGDRLTSSSVESPDGKAAYVQVNLVGNQGTPAGDQSVAAVRSIVDRISRW
jgi:RND superfamily putative drug exporter